ncbi:transglycosylase domain-containing protein [Bacillus fonticola]|uniref:transglycosylase domain-containing protein n=1 Tax=Bacillus fonticola TaxID=2728853 RepID=UPI001475D33F|nr:PBP1A family penicillin-binding protein [Bacillus fonticola]
MAEGYGSREERRKAKQQKPSSSGKKKQDSKKTSAIQWVKRVVLIFAIIGVLGLLGGAGLFAYYASSAPSLDPEMLKDPLSSKIYDNEGNVIRVLGSERRDFVPYDEIPQIVKDAVISIEDARFYEHMGFDPIRLGGAVIANITEGFGSEGASTITQQVIKQSFLTQDKTLKRKAQEAWLAIQLEQEYEKEEIFEMYVNKNLMGGNINGIATASQYYYGVPIQEVSLPQAALLAGIPQLPNVYDPFKNPEAAKERRDTVLNAMVREEKITEAEAEEAKAVPIVDMILPEEQRAPEDTPYDAFVDLVIEEVEALGEYDIFTDGLNIYTTLDTDAQNTVDEILASENIGYPDENFQAGITLLDTATGEVRAIGGGRNQTTNRGWNFAVDEIRQPGSTIKPILDYGPAFEYLQWSTHKQMVDGPTEYSWGDSVNNWNDSFDGQMSVRRALALSKNTVAVQTFQEVGADRIREFGENLGIPLDEQFGEPYAIGGFNSGVNTLQLAGAYSAFGNNGVYTEPHTVRKIVLRDEETEIDVAPKPKVVMNESTAYMVTDILKDVFSYGTASAYGISGVPMAGKTGTTNYDDRNDGSVPDSWMAGYSTEYTAAIWTGYQDRSIGIPAGAPQQIARKIYQQLMQQVHEGMQVADFKKPSSVVEVAVERGSDPARLPSDFTPDDQIVTELFIKGTEPTEVSEKFDRVDPVQGLTANYNEKDNTITLNWEYSRDSEDTRVTFDINISLNDEEFEPLTTLEETTLVLEEVFLDTAYSFEVIANVGDEASDPESVEIVVPAAPEDEEDEGIGDIIDLPGEGGDRDPENDDPQNDGSGDEDSGDENSGGNNDGSGDGTGSGNGNGNNNGGNGSGDSGGNNDEGSGGGDSGGENGSP